MLFVETGSKKSDLMMELDEFWRAYIHFPNIEKIRPGTVEMAVKRTNRRTVSEVSWYRALFRGIQCY